MTRNSGSRISEKIVDLGVDAWMMEEKIFRIKGKQAEQGKNHQKKKQYADKFFSHGLLKNKPEKQESYDDRILENTFDWMWK